MKKKYENIFSNAINDMSNKTDNIFSSKDGATTIPYKAITHACMCVSMYSLLQYLLLHDEDTIKNHTVYFCGYAVNRKVSSKLPSVYFKTHQTIGKLFTPSRWMDKIFLRMTRNKKYPFLKHCKIYAQDIGFLPSLIGRRKYSMLSDGPNCLSLNMQPNSVEYQRQLQKAHSLQGMVEQLLYGRLSVFNMGNNNQCQEIFMTEKNTSPILDGKDVHINSFADLWQNSSKSKKTFIMDVFDLSYNDVEILSSKPVMFLTQPLVQDNILTESEYVTLLSSIFKNYNVTELILKLHPRDNFYYQKYFPELTVYTKPINIQLLVLLGIKIKKAVTICSSSINAFPEEVEVDWYGAQVHSKIHAFYGDSLVPYRKYTLMTNALKATSV